MKCSMNTAREFAVAAHGGQQYGEYPYEVHLQSVESVLIEFGYGTATLRAAAWLHDILEDTATPFESLRSQFSAEVCELVLAVTSEPGTTRQERNAKTYVKWEDLPLRVMANIAPLKLADRIANVRNARNNEPRLYKMYEREHPQFKYFLENFGGSTAMWEELDSLFGATTQADDAIRDAEDPTNNLPV